MAKEILSLGRRKTSVARVKMVPGSGKVLINGSTPVEYFPNALVIQDMQMPLQVTKLDKEFDILVKVEGGGFTGQAGAIRLAISKGLIVHDEKNKKMLRENGLVTRDQRIKERKKYGKYGARRSPQFTKR